MIDFLLENKEWLFNGLGVLVLSSFFALFLRKHKKAKSKSSKLTVSKPTVSGDYSWGKELPHTSEIFYPEPFDYTPHLKIAFPRQRPRVRGRRSYGKEIQDTPVYDIIEQHPDRFVIKIRVLDNYEPYLTWKAKGIISR